MNYTLVPGSKTIGNIPCSTLRDAIGMKHCLFSKLSIISTIQDKDGCIVSEKEQSELIFQMFC